MLTRIKVQLWLVEAIFQITMSFFPKTNMGVVRLREDQLVAELAVVSPSAAEEPLPQLPMKQIPPIKASVFNQSDRRVLGCFTPAQALFSVDLLGECINFTHVFNADVTLRRKLHNAGLHIPVPTVPSHIHQPIIAPVAIPTTPQPSSAVISTVPASPAPVPHVHPVAVSAPPAAPAPASTPNQSLPSTAAGPAKPARLPQLFYHEAHALRLAMDILFKLVTEGRGNPSSPERYLWDEEIRLSLDANAPMAQAPVDAIQLCEERIIYLCHSVIDEYIHKTQSGQLVSVESMDESMVGLLNNFAAFPAEMFQRYLPEFYTSLTQLIEYANVPSIRHSVRLLFEHNIRGLLQLEQPRQR